MFMKRKIASTPPIIRESPTPATVAALFAQANDRPQHMATEYKTKPKRTRDPE